MANPYMLFTAYERTAYAELLAAAWIPLLLLAVLRERVTAVSYTHLDVYKRQAQDRLRLHPGGDARRTPALNFDCIRLSVSHEPP